MNDLVFVSVPYSENNEKGIHLSIMAEQYIKNKLNRVPISPLLFFDKVFNENYEESIDACKVIISKCSSILIVNTGKLSKGQKIDFEFAKQNNIPYILISEKELNFLFIRNKANKKNN